MKKALIALTGILGATLATGWLGLRMKPKPFGPYRETTPDLETIELPSGLPAPVARFFETIFGENIPVINSAVITGTVALRINGLPLPGRFRIIHVAGQAYRHYIEVTFFGYPILKVNESYLDGSARLALPFGVVENEPKVDMAANLGLWAESVWLPSIFVTDPRVRWETIDEVTARLVVPFREGEDALTVTFSPHSGLIWALEAMRYRDAKDEAKILWRNEPLGWRSFHGVTIPSPASVTWMDQGVPWSVWTIEEMVYNVDVSEYIKGAGLSG